MAETQRTFAALQTLLADNASGDISAQDLRDLMTSLTPGYGGIYISSAAETTIDTINVWKDAAGTHTLTADAKNWDMNTNGQLRYTGVPDIIAEASMGVSMTTAANNKVVEFGIGLNSAIITATVGRHSVGTGTDTERGATGALVAMSTNDFLTVMFRNTTDNTNMTAESTALRAVSTVK